MNERRLNLPETSCNIPMPETVKPPKGEALCNSCVHMNVCSYSAALARFAGEVDAITGKYEYEIFEVSINCKHRKPNAVLR